MKDNIFVNKKPKTIKELRQMVAMKSAFGKTPKDLVKEDDTKENE